MGSASLQFLGFALAVIVVFNLGVRSLAWRQGVLLVASLIFLSFFSHDPLKWTPFAVFVLAGFASARLLQKGTKPKAYVPLLVATIFAFVWLKKYSFVPSETFLRFPYVTLGISYIFFRVLHLIIDAHNKTIEEEIRLVPYLNYTLNFTTLVSGPIQRYQDFVSTHLSRRPLELNVIIGGEAFERIAVGFFKVNVLSLLLSMAQTQAIGNLSATCPFNDRVWYGIVIAASYPLYLYCNFSGYIDIVIGIARFLRMELPENFNRPFSSDNFINFWSRWHITLSEWLKSYVYNPLLIALMRRFPSTKVEPFLGVISFFVTFFLVGLWHGQTSVFIFFGILQGGGVSMTKLYQVVMAKRLGKKRYRSLANGALYNVFSRGLTFTWFGFTLMWFWSNWEQLGTFVHDIGYPAIALAWLIIFVASSLILAAWEALRKLLLGIRFGDGPLLHSRYTRTVWDTALVVTALATVTLLNAPAPEIVYKAF